MQTDDNQTSKHIVLRWNRDRTPAPPQEIENPNFRSQDRWRAGDIDGDGRDEVIGARESSFTLWRIDPAAGGAVSLGTWFNTLGIHGGGLADLSGDGRDDLYWFESFGSWIWSLNTVGGISFTRTGIPFVPLLRNELSAVDVDTDGRPDLVGDGRFGLVEMIIDPLGSPSQSVWVLPEALGTIDLRALAIVWADVDRDGDQDLVTFAEDGIRVHRNQTLQRTDGGAQAVVRFTGRHPAHDEARVAVHAERAGRIVLELFDVAGRLIWTEERNAGAEGWLDVPIRPRVGRASVPSGVYFLRVEVSGRVETQRIVLGF